MGIAIVMMAVIQIFLWRRWSCDLSDAERYNAMLCEENVKLRQIKSSVEDDNAVLRVRQAATRQDNEALRREMLLHERAMVLHPQMLHEEIRLVEKDNQRLRHENEKLIRAAAANVSSSTNVTDAPNAANTNTHAATTTTTTTPTPPPLMPPPRRVNFHLYGSELSFVQLFHFKS
ncbi:unnamed protein product [Lampetra fluviatilis]